MGACLAAYHIYAVDLRDEKRRLRFHPFHPIRLLQGDATRHWYKYTIGNVTYGNRIWVRTLTLKLRGPSAGVGGSLTAGGSNAGSYLADPASPIPSHCAVITLFQSVPVHQLS